MGEPLPAAGERAPVRLSRLSLAWYALTRAVVELVCRTYWRVEIIGKDKIPQSGPFVIAPVHRSNIDTLLAGCLVRRRIRFMGKESLWKYRWSAALFDSLGAFPVQRGTPDREAMRACEEALRGGEPVVLFPEGTRQSGPVLQPLFEGAAFVAARSGVPIVPVGIGGSEWAMPKGSRKMLPVKVVMVVADPIPPPERSGSRVPRKAVAAVTDELSRRLQQAFDESLELAGRI
jgi:1-acyl-sn-glycerol-3-phosphate acyltransferase